MSRTNETRYIEWHVNVDKLANVNVDNMQVSLHRFLRIWSHLMKKSLMENYIFCAVCL